MSHSVYPRPRQKSHDDLIRIYLQAFDGQPRQFAIEACKFIISFGQPHKLPHPIPRQRVADFQQPPPAPDISVPERYQTIPRLDEHGFRHAVVELDISAEHWASAPWLTAPNVVTRVALRMGNRAFC